MSGEDGHTIPVDAYGYLRQQQKVTDFEQRRPRITKASDILGPSLGPFAIQIDNLDSDLGAFNGMWVAPPGALNSPANTTWVAGYTIASEGNGGFQFASLYLPTDAPHTIWTRGWAVVPGTTTRAYSAWAELESGAPAYDPNTMFSAREDLAAYATGVTYTIFDIRRIAKFREIRGNPNRSLPTGSTDIATALPVSDRPNMNVFANCYIAGGNVGVVFIRPAGTIAINNMSGATRSGAHQFTLIYTVD